MELAELAGDAAAVGASPALALAAVVVPGPGSRTAYRYGTRAVAALEPLGDGHELGMAYSNLAQLAMLAGDVAALPFTGASARSPSLAGSGTWRSRSTR